MLAEVTWEFADAEGEGFTDVGRLAHARTSGSGGVTPYRSCGACSIRRFDLDDTTVVVCEWFVFEPLAVPLPWPGEPEVSLA